MIVIDTQALVWLMQADRRLGAEATRTIEKAREQGGVLIPPIMGWEVGMLVDRGRLALGMAPTSWFERIFEQEGFALAPMDIMLGIDAGLLPGSLHGDPADRMMIATARAMQAPLLTADEKILAYAAQGHVHAIDASR